MAKTDATSDGTIESFAEDLGTLLGNARNRADKWLGERQTIIKHLTELRDTATHLLNQLGDDAKAVVQARRRGGPPLVEGVFQPQPGQRKRRKMSKAARKAISEAQKARWARVRAGRK